MEERELRAYSPLALAYLGDAVYSLYMREQVVKKANTSAHRLHRETVRYVSAEAQAAAAEALLPFLTEEEREVYRRGRNAKSGSGAKNASREEYHRATGLECLVGWLYLREEYVRLREIMEKVTGFNGQGQ